MCVSVNVYVQVVLSFIFKNVIFQCQSNELVVYFLRKCFQS